MSTAAFNPVHASEILAAMSDEKTRFSEHDSLVSTIFIRSVLVRDELVIDQGTFPIQVWFDRCDFQGGIHIRGGEFNGLRFSGGRIMKSVRISGGVFNNRVSLAEVDASRLEKPMEHSVVISGGQFNCPLNIYRGAFKTIRIGNADLTSVTINDEGPMMDRDLRPYIKRLEIAPRGITVFEVRERKIEHLELLGILNGGVYSFDRVELNELKLDYFINRGQVLFQALKFKRLGPKGLIEVDSDKEASGPALSMTYSDLGKTQFYDLDFTRLRSIEIRHCAMGQVESSNTNWFQPAQLRGLAEERKRDLFRQLKHAMIQQGNRFDQLHFQAEEMDAYRKMLKFSQNPADLIILAIGKYTNNFGTNYILPVVWMIVVAGTVFLCSARSVGVPPQSSWGGFFAVLNPAHPIDYLVPKGVISNTFMAIDFVGRVLISILIYQLIVPFRKFARD